MAGAVLFARKERSGMGAYRNEEGYPDPTPGAVIRGETTAKLRRRKAARSYLKKHPFCEACINTERMEKAVAVAGRDGQAKAVCPVCAFNLKREGWTVL
jgi:hypothetical protein